MRTSDTWECRIPQPLNCFQKQRVGYRAGQGFASRNTSRNTRGCVQGEVLLVPLISCSNEATQTQHLDMNDTAFTMQMKLLVTIRILICCGKFWITLTPSTLTGKQKEMPQTGNETTLTQLMAMRLIKKSEERVTKQKVDNYTGRS